MASVRQRLPSTTALRTLLAVAERGYTTAAAESLNLSQSAVSKQLLGLEELIGGPAFVRTGQGMIPTEAGKIYLQQARIAIKAMEDAALQVARLKPDPKALRLQVLPIFGDRWLLPRFADFTGKFPDIDVQFTTFVSATQAENPDGIFTFGVAPPAGEMSSYLFGREIALVGTAGYWEKIGYPDGINDLAGAVMLEHPQTPLHWSDFASAAGSPDVKPRHTIRFGYYTMVIRAALAGQGMALIPRGLIADDLKTGRLVNPAGLGYTSDFAYWFTVPSGPRVSPTLQIFIDWLQTTSRDQCETA
ncbi:LysR substrate-binding domain-containing protein [Aquamicrobium sp. LC103]|uniref:LysR substrate-binding domain-containing protein n=1 Tax=Aquamicrobium sp. LC103 TaxID=1120658 RepID=UPI00063EB19E|nr:LysR substrate-binding domain-containing protein [Aquamicrobium sp. LC103]TKT75085.1 LysR family transcriptional regulator [Aquamicrobium sp. LC103]